MSKDLGGRDVSELRATAMAKHDSRGARLIDELDALLKLLRFQREALNNECFEGMGYKQLAADKSTILKSKELSLAYTRLVEAQIKLNKSLKEIAEGMTPEEEKEAVKKYIYAMDHGDRGHFLEDTREWHNRQARLAAKAEMRTFIEEDRV